MMTVACENCGHTVTDSGGVELDFWFQIGWRYQHLHDVCTVACGRELLEKLRAADAEGATP